MGAVKRLIKLLLFVGFYFPLALLTIYYAMTIGFLITTVIWIIRGGDLLDRMFKPIDWVLGLKFPFED